MSLKRQNTSSPEAVDSDRQQSISESSESQDDYPTGNKRPQVSAVTGQAGAFPGLHDEDEVFYGPAADGIDYLRMVRSEARGIPHLLTAAKDQDFADVDEDTRDEDGGYYFDGTYTANPVAEEQAQDTNFGTAQQQYYEAMLTHFRLIRATVRCTPPLPAIQSLDSTHPISFPTSNRAARSTWETQFLKHTPHPVQISCLEVDSVFEAIKLMTKRMTKFFKSNNQLDVERIGTWIWSLLGKCPDRGELASEEISDLRSLAKRANEISAWLQNKSGTEMEKVEPEDDFEEGIDESGDEAMLNCNFRSDLPPPQSRNSVKASGHVSVGMNTRNLVEEEADDASTRSKMMVLEMITTVVGEFYGQRDLLESRVVWS